jgi:hypothetical protein
MRNITWPENKRFAFTVFDDCDFATVANVGPVYDFLHQHGFRTTKSVWPLSPEVRPLIGGETCADPHHLKWLLDLKSKGFEIGLHNASNHTSTRARTLAGLNCFRELFGHDPFTCANHADCQESIYWGNARLSGWRETVYNILLRYRHNGLFRGHIEGDPLFWGDLCRERIRYVRNFVFKDMNTLSSCPWMPYHDPTKPHVNGWFASSEGPDVRAFSDTICEANQDRLEAEGGACIMYTHFASGFCTEGVLDRRWVELMTRLSSKGGWFVPVSTLLDFLSNNGAPWILRRNQLARMEWGWLLHKIRVGST